MGNIAAKLLLEAIAAGALCAGCSPNPRQTLVDQIEAQVRLPEGAHRLGKYSRYYAMGPDGEVWGSFMVHQSNDFEATLSACRELSVREFPCSGDGNSVELIRAGETLWIDDYSSLPAMDGGGCRQVSFRYHPSAQHFSHVECNGPY